MLDVKSLVSKHAEARSIQPRTAIKKPAAEKQKIIEERSVRRVCHSVQGSMNQCCGIMFERLRLLF